MDNKKKAFHFIFPFPKLQYPSAYHTAQTPKSPVKSGALSFVEYLPQNGD